jgi:hypothetical protein
VKNLLFVFDSQQQQILHCVQKDKDLNFFGALEHHQKIPSLSRGGLEWGWVYLCELKNEKQKT